MRISDWSSDVCSSDLWHGERIPFGQPIALLHLCSIVVHELRAVRQAVNRTLTTFLVDDRQFAITSKRQTTAPTRSVRYLARRSEEHTSELQSLMRTSYAVFCLKKKKQNTKQAEVQQQ